MNKYIHKHQKHFWLNCCFNKDAIEMVEGCQKIVIRMRGATNILYQTGLDFHLFFISDLHLKPKFVWRSENVGEKATFLPHQTSAKHPAPSFLSSIRDSRATSQESWLSPTVSGM